MSTSSNNALNLLCSSGSGGGGGDNLGNHTATQALNMNNNQITGLAAPTSATDAATKAYVDTSGGGGITNATIVTANISLNNPGTTPVCPAGYFRTGCSSNLGSGSYALGTDKCKCSPDNTNPGTCYMYCAK